MPSLSNNLPSVCAIVLILSLSVEAQLSIDHYYSSCPQALHIVHDVVVEALRNDSRMAASLLRLHFHDCFVNGCDGSVLLDDNTKFAGEKRAYPNDNSLRGFNVIDIIKARLEKACPNIVSCADILAIAARDAVFHTGGPTWEVELGRRDALTASRDAANIHMPSSLSNITVLTANFAAVGLSFEDLIALSGAHTLGYARCKSFRPRIYGDVNINPSFGETLRKKCPRVGNDSVLEKLDFRTQSRFDNLYYKNLLTKQGLLHSDQELYNSNKADPIVRKYSRDVSLFFRSFSRAMIKMGAISPPNAAPSEIRRHCRSPNIQP
ncbi:peroxidase P7-like [Silene latifolia]|uniref:peroxidase P7-like n=1 Tax=Silene latifolia TaxID=37657 RepID=UPI003D789CA5